MTVSALDQKTVQLMADQMIMKSKTTLTQYEMTKWSLEKTEKGISMIIVFKRMVTSELLTTYMPSLLLIFTTYATTFFKPFYFEAAVTVNLTTMLVMTTIFTNLMDKLPPTAYVKMIDIWLIGGQLIPFIEVLLLTIVEMLSASLNEIFKIKKIKVVLLTIIEMPKDCLTNYSELKRISR